MSPRVSPDDSGKRGRGDGGRPGLGRYQDGSSAAGLRSRADQTAAAGSGRAIHQEQHVSRTAGRLGGDVRGRGAGSAQRKRTNASPEQQPGRGRFTWGAADKNSHRLPRLMGFNINTRESMNVNDADICIVL